MMTTTMTILVYRWSICATNCNVPRNRCVPEKRCNVRPLVTYMYIYTYMCVCITILCLLSCIGIQVLQALQASRAFCRLGKEDQRRRRRRRRFFRLDQEVILEATDEIVAALSEVDEESNWMSSSIDDDVVTIVQAPCCEQAVRNLDQPHHPMSQQIVRHCLRNLCREDLVYDDEQSLPTEITTLHLSIQKVS